MEAGTTSTILTAKLPILNPGEYDLWLMRIEQYFLMTDYSLWEVILNGNKVLKRKIRERLSKNMTLQLQEKRARRNEIKLKGTAVDGSHQIRNNRSFIHNKYSKLSNEAYRIGMGLVFEGKSTNSNSSKNEVDNTASGVSVAHTQSNPTSRDNLSDAVICAFLATEEEHPINFALMAHTSSGSSSSSDSEVDSCLESVEARLDHYKKNEVVYEESINVLNLDVKLRDNALIENKKKLEKAEKERDELKLTLEKFQNSSKSLNNLLESQVIEKFKTGLEYNKSKSDKGYHAVPPPFTGNFIPRKPDLTFMDEIVESENMDVTIVVTPGNVKTVESNLESANLKSNGDAVESKTIRKNSFRPPVIEDWNSDDESEVEIIPKDKTVRSSTEKIKFIKTARETVEKVETSKQNKHYPRGNQRNWNNLMSQRLGSDFKMINKACFVCGSFEHLHYVCDKMVIRLVWNNSSRVNHKNFANKISYPYANRRFVPQAVLTRFGKINTVGVSVNTAVRLVNTAGSKPTVNHPTPISNAYKKGYS
ncbi:hypothetical protein Tco_1337201 [Tanacetum coccineum]